MLAKEWPYEVQQAIPPSQPDSHAADLVRHVHIQSFQTRKLDRRVYNLYLEAAFENVKNVTMVDTQVLTT